MKIRLPIERYVRRVSFRLRFRILRAASAALGEGARGDAAGHAVLHGYGLHRGGVGQRQGFGVLGARSGRR